MKWVSLEISMIKIVLLVLFLGALVFAKPWDWQKIAPFDSEKIERFGPFNVEPIRGRNASVRFRYIGRKDPGFLIARYEFNRDINVFSVINDLRSQGDVQAYIWVNRNSNDTFVWKVDFNDKNVLSYETAEKNRRASMRLRNWNLAQTAIFGLAFLCSLIRWKKNNST